MLSNYTYMIMCGFRFRSQVNNGGYVTFMTMYQSIIIKFHRYDLNQCFSTFFDFVLIDRVIDYDHNFLEKIK